MKKRRLLTWVTKSVNRFGGDVYGNILLTEIRSAAVVTVEREPF